MMVPRLLPRQRAAVALRRKAALLRKLRDHPPGMTGSSDKYGVVGSISGGRGVGIASPPGPSETMYLNSARASDSDIWFMFIHPIGGKAVRVWSSATH